MGFGGGVDGSAGRVVRQVNGNGLVELVAQGEEDFGRGEAALLASRNHVDRAVVLFVQGKGAVQGFLDRRVEHTNFFSCFKFYFYFVEFHFYTKIITYICF